MGSVGGPPPEPAAVSVPHAAPSNARAANAYITGLRFIERFPSLPARDGRRRRQVLRRRGGARLSGYVGRHRWGRDAGIALDLPFERYAQVVLARAQPPVGL